MPSARLAAALTTACAAALLAPSAAPAATVVAGKAGNSRQLVVAKVDRRAVSRFSFSYDAACSDGTHSYGSSGFTFRQAFRRGRFAIVGAKAGDDKTITIRARRTRSGLSGSIKVDIALPDGTTCRQPAQRFSATRRYIGGTTNQRYPWVGRISADRRTVLEFSTWDDETCSDDTSVVGRFSLRNIAVGAGGAFTFELNPPPEDEGTATGQGRYTLSGRVRRSGMSGTATDDFVVTDKASGAEVRRCSSGDVTFTTWR